MATQVQGGNERQHIQSSSGPKTANGVTYGGGGGTSFYYTWETQEAVCLYGPHGYTAWTLDGGVTWNNQTFDSDAPDNIITTTALFVIDGVAYSFGWDAPDHGFIEAFFLPPTTTVPDTTEGSWSSAFAPPAGIDGALQFGNAVVALVNNGTLLVSPDWTTLGTASGFKQTKLIPSSIFQGIYPEVFGWDSGIITVPDVSESLFFSGPEAISIELSSIVVSLTSVNSVLNSSQSWGFDDVSGFVPVVVGVMNDHSVVVIQRIGGGFLPQYVVLLKLPADGSAPTILRNLTAMGSPAISVATDYLPSPIPTSTDFSTTVLSSEVIFHGPGYANGNAYTITSHRTTGFPAAGLGGTAHPPFVPDLWQFDSTTGDITYLASFASSVFEGIDNISGYSTAQVHLIDRAFADDGAGSVMIALYFDSGGNAIVHTYTWDGVDLTFTGSLGDRFGSTPFVEPFSNPGAGSHGFIRFGKTLVYSFTSHSSSSPGPALGTGSTASTARALRVWEKPGHGTGPGVHLTNQSAGNATPVYIPNPNE